MTNRIQSIRPIRRLAGLALAFGLALAPAGCDFLDPTDVENPRTTPEDLAQAQEPTRSLLPGLRAQFARMISATAVLPEVVSDNYSIHGTGLNSVYDFPRDITPNVVNGTGTATGLYWNAQELRALADFVLNDIAPGDETATAEMVAEAHYYRGMAYLTLGENFAAAPIEEDAPAVTPDSLFSRAETELQAATGGGDPIGVAAQAALARVYRWTGEGAAAATSAQAVLAADPDFVFMVEYDRSSVSNAAYSFLVFRALREMQPLPRLDFLDPKYIDFESGIPVATAEEMHLILAEVDMADGDWASGRDHLADGLEAALARPTVTFVDDDPRQNADLSVRPRDAEIIIAADDGAPFRAGLVLERPGTIQVPVISSTSLNPDSIRSIPATDEDALLHALYLARQEIMILEGRRMADLGIRLPIMLREIETNPSIAPGDAGTVAIVPAYIPTEGQIDLYSPKSPYPAGTLPGEVDVEPSALEVTIMHDMNAVLVQNRSALPLFGS